MKIKGIYTPIVTPFGKNNEIDYESLETILKFLLKKQIHGIVVGGTTGEYFSLNFQERIQLFDFVKKNCSNLFCRYFYEKYKPIYSRKNHFSVEFSEFVSKDFYDFLNQIK